MKKAFLILSLLLLVGFILLILNKGFENQKDPFWFYLDTLLYDNFVCEEQINFSGIVIEGKRDTNYKVIQLKEKVDTLQKKYELFHNNETSQKGDIVNIWDAFKIPFEPTWEWRKIFSLLDEVIAKKKVVISGVSGSGKTTVVDNLAKFIAGSYDRIYRLQCVEEMGVEYHKIWIGYYDNEGFHKGKLLEVFEKCGEEPNQNYVFILDDFDKIYPATFFGAEIWEELDEPKKRNYIEGYPNEIEIPQNFYLICVTHEGESNIVELNDEHYRRLGEVIFLKPNYIEFMLYLKNKYFMLDNIVKRYIDYINNSFFPGNKIIENSNNLSLQHIKNLLYFFEKANQHITQKYGLGLSLGQWSSVRKYYKEKDFENFIDCFVKHINGFKVKPEITQEEFEFIVYTINNNGYIKNSSFMMNLFKQIYESGVFAEGVVALAFALITGISGWFLIIRKRRITKSLLNNIVSDVNLYKENKVDYETIYSRLIKYKQDLEELLIKEKLKPEIVNFLFHYIKEQIELVDKINELNRSSSDFLKMLNEFMQDNKITEAEYKVLHMFLESIKGTISNEVYFRLKNYIEEHRVRSE